MEIVKDYEGKGCMVALYPDPKLAAKLAVEGGEAKEELHVTLAFLKTTPEDLTKLQSVIAGVAHTVGPLTGNIAGKGEFNPSSTSDGKPVTYASIDLPGLPSFRQRLVEALDAAGFPVSKDHGYSPHMTLAYDKIDSQPTGALKFDEVVLAAQGKKFTYPMDGTVEKAITPGGREGDDSHFSTSTDSNWVARAGGLPKYILEVAHALIKSGHDESSAIATAVATMKRWSAGGGHVRPQVQAAASEALAEWEKMKSVGKSDNVTASTFAEIIKASGYEEFEKRVFTNAQREAASKTGAAMPDGSFPIKDVKDLHNAIQAIGRAKDPVSAKRHIKRRAAVLGASNAIPDTWVSKTNNWGPWDQAHPPAGLGRGAGYNSATQATQVTALQTQLQGAGISPGAIDGKFGPNTAAAVSQYQAANGLRVDGVVGPQTMGMLQSGGSGTPSGANMALVGNMVPRGGAAKGGKGKAGGGKGRAKAGTRNSAATKAAAAQKKATAAANKKQAAANKQKINNANAQGKTTVASARANAKGSIAAQNAINTQRMTAVKATLKANPIVHKRDEVDFRIDVPISKLNDEQHLAFGWAQIANDKDGNLVIDRQKDFITDVHELEKAAYHFVLNSRDAGEMHIRKGVGTLVESMMFTPEKKAALGIPPGILPDGWLVGYHINDAEVWKGVKSGKYPMFSVHGRGTRKHVEGIDD
jgi:peptidoglycan hydrolase-like protein with peptidoglycan-binding domain/2'-5' RNA ligase